MDGLGVFLASSGPILDGVSGVNWASQGSGQEWSASFKKTLKNWFKFAAVKNKDILIYIVPLIMGIVALNQIRLAQFGLLSPWKGGGFGMFASNAGPDMRVLLVQGIDESGDYHLLQFFQEELLEESWTRGYAQRLQTFPNLEGLMKVSKAMAKAHYVKRLNYGKHSVAMRLGWEYNDPVFQPINSIKLASLEEKTYQFKSIKTSIYEFKYTKSEHSLKFEEILSY